MDKGNKTDEKGNKALNIKENHSEILNKQHSRKLRYCEHSIKIYIELSLI